jgi:DGQHR domain-containing protein
MTRARGKPEIVVRALRTSQGDGVAVYAFFIRGSDIVRIADISRVERDEGDSLKGFQRPEIRNHVKGITEYLNQKDILFPNAIILAISREVRFVAARGTKPTGDEGLADAGTLTIPIHIEGERVAWIVDGQQRSLGLAQASNQSIAVPVIAFVSDSLAVQREQFILVNKAKPLPTRLINELLPETREVLLPRDLLASKIPSEICGLLNREPGSPFFRLIKRPSDKSSATGVVTDTPVIRMIRASIKNPLGALAPFKATSQEPTDLASMYQLLVTYWTAVKEVFPEAWGKDPTKSRLMHKAGIEAMGMLMDKICARLGGNPDVKDVRLELERVAPFCRWTSGTWDSLGLAWNDIEGTGSDIRKLQDALVRAYAGVARQ